MRRARLFIPLTIVVALIAGACSTSGVPGATTTTTDTTAEPPDGSQVGGDRDPVQLASEEYGHARWMLTGSLTLQDNGCWTVDLGDGPRLVVFPEGYSKPATDGSAMESPDGAVVHSGMQIDAIGGVVPTSTMPGGSDGYWGNYVAFCDPSRPEVAVLDSIEPAFDPGALSDGQLSSILLDADLAVSWPCGLGFAVSSEDQRVALTLYWSGSADATEPPVILPDATWDARVVVGKNLMSNNCDDVMEGWEPMPEIAAEWRISSGTLEFTAPEDEGCGVAGPVAATLTDVSITTSGGEVALGDISLVNEAFGCFAG